MKRSSVFVMILSAAFSFLSAQDKPDSYKVTGQVIDLFTSKPLNAASVIIFSKSTGKEIKGTKTDERGNFTIPNISEKKVRARFSMIGYQTQVIDSVSLDQSAKLGLIKLMPTAIELPEVVIKSIKPMIEFHADKQVINIDRLPDNSGSVTEALKNTGLVDVDPQTNAITIRGQGVKLQMDGHEYSVPSDMLAQLPASMLDQVEVILAPGAKESAEGGTYIINFLTKKQSFSNTSGMISFSSATNKSNFGGLYFNYKAGSLNLFAQAYGNLSENKTRSESERYVYTSPDMYYQKTTGDGTNNFRYGYFKVGLDYDFDENNSVTFYSNYNGYKSTNDQNGGSLVNNRSNIFQYSYSDAEGYSYTNTNLSFYGFYKKKFAAKGNELTFDVMYTLIGNPSDSKMNYGYSNKLNNPQLQNSNTDITAKTFIFKTDYTLPFKEDKLEAGYSFTHRTRNNNYTALNYSYLKSSWLDSLNLSNQFEYTENINAFYMSYAYKLDKFDVKLGMRTENLATHGDQFTSNMLFDENYLSLFPNLNVSYNLSDLLQVGFNAFRRVSYPQIYYLNPFRQYEGPNSFYAGNPKLKPNYVNSFAFNLSQYLSLYYTYTTGDFTSATAVENDSVLVQSFVNLNSQDTYGFSVTFPYYNSPMMPFHLPDFISSCYVSFNYRYFKQSGQYLNQDLTMTDKTYTLNANLGIKLGYDINAGLYLYYMPKIDNKLTVRGEMKYLTLYFSKTLMERKLRISLSVSDLLNNQKRTYETIGSYYRTSSTYEMLNSRGIRLGLSYSINDYKDRRDRSLDDGRDAGNTGAKTDN